MLISSFFFVSIIAGSKKILQLYDLARQHSHKCYSDNSKVQPKPVKSDMKIISDLYNHRDIIT